MKDSKRGAALVIAIAIMTVLLLIALTFFTISRAELKVSTNVTNSYRTDLIANGALAVAMATLNHDLAIHATYTSTDHEWKTRFNNGWAAGKQWAWKGGVSLTAGGIPEINLDQLPFAPDEPNKPLFTSQLTQPWLYIPRIQGNIPLTDSLRYDFSSGNPLLAPPTLPRNPFVVTSEYGVSPLADLLGLAPGALTSSYNGRGIDFALALLPDEQLHFFNDVDNDGDGLKDSAWIPMAADKDLSGDGVDNDLDGNPDNHDSDGKAHTEYAYFVYCADTANPNLPSSYRLTAPILAPAGNPPFTSLVRQITVPNRLGITINLNCLPRRLDTNSNVDDVDNDYNQIVNDHEEYIYRYFPNGAVADRFNPTANEMARVYVDSNVDNTGRPIGYGLVNLTTIGNVQDVLRRRFHPVVQLCRDYGDGSFMVVTSTGEPVGELVGRYAIDITDESSKINLNATGGRVYNDAWKRTNSTTDPIVRRALNQGVTTWEYDTRVLPDINLALTDHMWSLLTGDWEGKGFTVNPAATQLNPLGGALTLDRGFPGYGFVDNNGDALWKALSGIDWDGNGFPYDGIVPRNYTTDVTAAPTLGRLETINGPNQYRQFRPYRNLPAENNKADDNGNGAVDEIGEAGDRALKTTEQIKNAFQIGDGTFTELQNVLTVHSTDKNERRRATDGLGVPVISPKLRQVTGLKLDYNYAQPSEIAANLAEDWGYPDMINLLAHGTGIGDPSTFNEAQLYLRSIATGNPALNDPVAVEFFRYALGLKREDMTVVAPEGLFAWNGGANVLTALPSDARLRAAQLAVNIKDSRDTDFARSEITTSVEDDLWWDDVQASNGVTNIDHRPIKYVQAGVENIRINEMMVRPVRRIEAEMNTDAGNVQFNPNQYGIVATGAAGFEDFINYSARGLAFRSRINNPNPVTAADVSDWSLDTTSSAYLGDRACYTTQKSILNNGGAPLDNAVQFLFGPSIGLPPGRYYLTVNTAGPNGAPTALRSTDFRYAIKYICPGHAGSTGFGAAHPTVPRLKVAGVTDILSDILAGVVVPWKGSPVIGLQDMAPGNPGLVAGTASGSNNATGWAFLPSDLASTPSTAPGFIAGYEQDDAYTIEIPQQTTNAADQIYLCVAVQMTNAAPAGRQLSINFFDFSQVPDHQWVELVNIDKSNDPNKAVDISGWQVEVGVPNMKRLDGGVASRTVLTVPNGTKIAPGGQVLLAVDKFDEFQDPHYTGNDLIKLNGIGLAKGLSRDRINPETIVSDLVNVTVPPIPNPLLGADPAASVFTRPFNASGTFPTLVFSTLTGWDKDYVDRDGLGVAQTGTIEDAVMSTSAADDFRTSTGPDKAWDRIVQVDVQADNYPVGTDLSRLAAVILSGGILPNYPEHDGVDNDGDDDALMNDYLRTGSPYPEHRGIDEGLWAFLGTPNNPVPGSFSDIPFGFTVNFTGTDLANPSPVDIGATTGLPPEWKEFIERRFYPGDCVVVTLYQGQIADGRVVDRVTYTEHDVTNRSIDDVVGCPYTDGSGNPATLNPNYLSFWLDNTMALDFYRSLERKHPLYNGDRFSTLNRWQATDGAYDDWASSASRFERRFDATGNVVDPPLDRADNATNGGVAVMFVHTLAGSPLRMNLSQRYIDNPLVYGSTTARQFGANADGQDYQEARGWAFSRAQAQNRAYVSAGDLLTLPHYSVQHIERGPSGSNFLVDDTQMNQSQQGVNKQGIAVAARQNLQVQEAILGQQFINDIRAVTSMEVNDSLALSVAQAAFTNLTPRTSPTNWQSDASAGAFLPADWQPVYLKKVDPSDSTTDPYHYLFQFDYRDATTPPNVTTPELLARWPLAQRAVMYTTGNNRVTGSPVNGFDPAAVRGAFLIAPLPRDASTPLAQEHLAAEVSFTWNADSGLENGDYDVYVAALDDISLLGVANVALGADSSSRNYLTNFGRDYVALANSIATKDAAFDLEFLTDKNGDRVAGIPVNAAGVAITTSTGAPIGADESFGMVTGVSPDTDGLIHYGMVRVENNLLKLNLRDCSKAGQMARISRVILTPHNRTPGRININTAETRALKGQAANTLYYFNTVTGVPGLLIDYDVTNSQVAYLTDPSMRTTNIATPSPLLVRAQKVAAQDPYGGHPELPAHRFRPEWFDGRYYRDTSDLVAYTDQLRIPDVTNATYGVLLGTITQPVLTSGALSTLGVLDVAATGVDQQVWNGFRFDEIQARYGHMANLVSTRSDVFEIIVTAQSGYLSTTDLNNDGRLDYRNDFVVTGEKKVRTIYER